MLFQIVKRTLMPLSLLLVKDIKGLENIPKKGAFIVAANHVSYLDPVIIPSIIFKFFKMKVHYLAKKELLGGWTGSIFLAACGNTLIPLDREKGGKIALKNALNALKDREIIGIFPKGTRSLTGKLQKGKTGVARLALAAKVPVVPVGIIGTFDLMPKGKLFPKFRKKVKVSFGKPIYFDKYYGRQNKSIFKKVTTIVMEKIADLSNQEYNQ